MKKTLFVLCLLSTTGAFAQYYSGAGHIDNTPVIYESPSHPAHASYTAMTQEQSVLGSSNYSSAQGERRASDFRRPRAFRWAPMPANSENSVWSRRNPASFG